MRTRTAAFAFFDIISIVIVFSFFLLIKPVPFQQALVKYLNSFLLFLSIWFVISILGKKYTIHREENLSQIFRLIVFSNILVMGVATTIMFLVRIDYYSRMVVFGTIAAATLLELLWGIIGYYLRTAILEPVDAGTAKTLKKRQLLKKVFLSGRQIRRKPRLTVRESAILVEIDQDAFNFVFSYAHIESPETLVISTDSQFNIDMQMKDAFETIVNLKRINDIRYINKFFESANSKLPMGGLFIDFVETKNLRKKRILKKYPILFNYIMYFLDFIVKRLFPKFKLTKGLYFFLTRGQNRVITKAETYGRLYSCGFD